MKFVSSLNWKKTKMTQFHGYSEQSLNNHCFRDWGIGVSVETAAKLFHFVDNNEDIPLDDTVNCWNCCKWTMSNHSYQPLLKWTIINHYLLVTYQPLLLTIMINHYWTLFPRGTCFNEISMNLDQRIPRTAWSTDRNLFALWWDFFCQVLATNSDWDEDRCTQQRSILMTMAVYNSI